MSHIGDVSKKVGDTPVSDSTPHNVADLGMLCRTLERLASVRLDYIKQLEANNDAANAEVDRLTAKVAQLYAGAEEQKQRIKRLEDRIDRASKAFFADCPDEDALSKMLAILEEERGKK